MSSSDLLIHSSNVGCSPFVEEEYPMTLHIVLQTPNNELAWITDTRAALGFGNTADIEKITYMEGLKVACSAWGDHSFTIRDEFVREALDGRLDLSTHNAILSSLREFVGRFNQQMLPALGMPRGNPGLVLASFTDNKPSLYVAIMAQPHPLVSSADQLWQGDEDNPAKIFADYYYKRSGKTIEEALFFGIHSMRLAHQLKAFYIGEPNAWVYRNGKFERLEEQELAEYIRKSESLDSNILRR
jgi:hypothetical protein